MMRNGVAALMMCFLRKRFCKSVGDEIKCPKDKRVWAKPYRPRRPEYKNITDYLRRFLFQNITVLPIVGEGLCALPKIQPFWIWTLYSVLKCNADPFVGDEIKCPKDKRVWVKPYRPWRPANEHSWICRLFWGGHGNPPLQVHKSNATKTRPSWAKPYHRVVEVADPYKPHRNVSAHP